MKLYYLLVPAMLLTGCKEQHDDVPNSDYVNKWIHRTLKTYYLWEEYMPTYAQTNAALAPSDYFAALLHKPDDRFSWIQENYTDLLNSLSGVQKEGGYDYALYRKSAASDEVVGVITYVKPHSPAALTTIKRGDIFNSINNEPLNLTNYRTLTAKLHENHTLGLVSPDDLAASIGSVEISTTEYQEHPIFLDTIYEIGGKRIGYLVYNFFAADNGDKSHAYDRALNAVFSKFKANTITDLVLDLRYNGGGAVSTAILLATMIGSQRSTDIFGIAQFNNTLTAAYSKEGADWNKDFFAANVHGEPLNQIGLQKFYVISSNGTASASELIINGLKPYADVVIIGDTTYGKNVGSYSLYETDNPNNKYGMQPIVVKFANAAGESNYGNGFAPNVACRENMDGHPLKQLGDVEEALLSRALNHIFGTINPARAAMRTISPALNCEKELWRAIDGTPYRKNMYIDPKQQQ